MKKRHVLESLNYLCNRAKNDVRKTWGEDNHEGIEKCEQEKNNILDALVYTGREGRYEANKKLVEIRKNKRKKEIKCNLN